MKDSPGDKDYQRSEGSLPDRPICRRRFLQGLGAVSAGLLASGCQFEIIAETPGPTSTLKPTGEPSPGRTPAARRRPTVTPSSTPTTAATATPDLTPQARVAIAQVRSYDRALVRRQVQALLDGLGGLEDVVSPGDRVAIKVNLTGGTTFEPPEEGLSATESYVTHPEVVRALGELLRDAGARELFIVEAVYEWASYQLWGYEEVATDIGATLIDLNHAHPYSDFAATPVGEGWFIYENFVFNPILAEVDAFISVAKMKCHWSAGVTHAMKNLIGLVPARYYRLEETHSSRTALHGPGQTFKTRLPRVIIDLNRARPIHLALIDGIKTATGGEGPWIPGLASVQPQVLIAGKDPVATDAVATAVMGFDPTVDYPDAPFLRADNHLNLGYRLGLGTNRLEEIEVAGASINDVRYEFERCRQG